MESCPEPDRLNRFVDDALDDTERAVIEAHLEECDDCRPVVAMLAKTASHDRREPLPPRPSGLEATLAAAALDPTVEVVHDALAATIADAASGHGAATLDSQRLSRRPHLPPKMKFDRYVLSEVLGAGGMGVVYAAHDPVLGRDVAIKVLRPEFATADPEHARRIAREAQVMARISDPNVIGVYDVGTHDDQVFISMELVSGGSLKRWLSTERSVAEVLEAFVAAGRGLIAAHNAGVVHRDFKPDNVLVGEDGRVRVTDFGLAHDHGETGEVDAEGKPRIAGTPGYMAPEQFDGGAIDARTDQFSFCVALYEALYGQRPFKGDSFTALGDAVTHGLVEPPPPGSRVPASLRAILLRGLSVKSTDRFPAMRELLVALGRDRGRLPRRVAYAATIALLIVGVGFGADGIVRERTQAVTRASFAGTRAQLDKLVAMRTQAFVAQSDALYGLPALQEVAATHDQADFGLGAPVDDKATFERIHENLASASWLAIASTQPGDELAIADAKGRLLYNTAEPDLRGALITSVPAIRAAYEATGDTSIGVVRAEEPEVVRSGVLGNGSRNGLYVVFARVKLENSVPRAAFVQMIPSASLREEVTVDDEADPTLLSVVSPDGTTEGTVPADIGARAPAGGVTEIIAGDQGWLVQRTPLRAAGQRAGVAQIILARRVDVGLAGLFAHARLLLALAALLLALAAVGGVVLARQRDLTRRGRRRR